MGSGAGKFYTCSYVGTGAAKTIDKVPFPPTCVMLVNWTDNDTFVVKSKDMPGDDCLNINATAFAKVTANGITLTPDGFDLGTDVAVNETGKTFIALCWE